MKENPELPQTMDNEHILSWERFRRGAKNGGAAGAAMGIAGGSVGIILGYAGSPELHQAITQHPQECLALLAFNTTMFSAVSSGVGAVVDSFRPTSRIVERRIAEDKQVWKDIKSGTIAAWKFFRDMDYKETAKKIVKGTQKVSYAIARPPVPAELLDHKAEAIGLATTYSTGVGTSLYLTGSVVYYMDRGFTHLSHLTGLSSASELPLIGYIPTHPLEIIGGSAALGFGIASYALTAHRNISQESLPSEGTERV